MRWDFLTKLPSAADTREGFCLLLLCAAMVFSVLNIGVHRLAEPLWKPLNHGLSPDGKEFISISLAGLRAHDAQTGRETQRVTWRSPWEFTDWCTSGYNGDEAYLFEHRDESTDFFEDYYREHEARVATEVSPSNRYVIGKFPGGCALWWDRVSGRTRVRCFPGHLLLRCYVDEAKDRYWLECIKFPRSVITRKTVERFREFQTESLLARVTDVWEMRLSDNAQLALHPDLKLGAPVNDDFRIRLVAQCDGEDPRLLQWEEFLQGEPKSVALATHWFLGQLEECQISLRGCQIVIDQAEDRCVLPPRDVAELGVMSQRTLRNQLLESSFPNTIRGSRSFFNNPYIGVAQADRPNQYRFQAEDYGRRVRDLLCLDVSGNEILRVADEKGRVLDIPTTQRGQSARRQMWLAPYPWAFLTSLVVHVLATALWIASASANRSLLASNGWFILFVTLLWPLFCWAAEQSTAYNDVAYGFRFTALTSCALIWSLAAALLVSGNRVLRPICISTAVGVSCYYLCTLGSWAYGSSDF